MKRFSVFLFSLLVSSFAFGQSGIVDILVSQDGLPKENYQLKIDDLGLKTNELGFVSQPLRPGAHKLRFVSKEEEQTILFKVNDRERTQLIVNILGESVVHDLTEPLQKTIKAKADFKDWGEVELKVLSVNGSPISNARIFAKGLASSATTNRAGIVLMKLPAGNQVLSFTHPKFSSQVIRDLRVIKNQKNSRTVELTPSGLVLDDFVVLAPNMKGSIQALIEVRRKASDVADVMSAEQMAKTGDSDAAGSLKRVTGLTLKDGKYVYVRGLGERYSATLLNGVALPSPDPSRRVIPLDLFPVQFLDSMVIQKSYSPNQPGEFGGGVVMLKTKSMPDKFFFKASLAQSVNSNDGDMKTYAGSGSDWLGVDDGRRKLPQDLSNPNSLLGGGDHALQDQQNETLPNFSFSTGGSIRLKAFKAGYTMSGVYKDSIGFAEQVNGRFVEENGNLKQEDNYVRSKTQKERVVGGIAGLQFKLLKDHSLSANYINIRNTTDYVAIEEGLNENIQPYRETQIEWAARTLNSILVQGESKIKPANDLNIKYSLANSKARRDEPSRMTYRYSPSNGQYVYNPADNTAYERRYYDLQEEANDLSTSVEMPFPWFGKRKGAVEVGAGITKKDRTSNMKRYAFGNPNSACNTDLSQDPDSIFAACPDSFNLTDTTRDSDIYEANQELKSYFFKSKWPLLKQLELSTGMRYEDSQQNVTSVKAISKTESTTVLNTRDWLPGSSLTWKMNKKMQMRFAYSETISRPDLRELSDTLWQDFDTGYDVQGNPTLRATIIESYDARWEWYFTPKENLSFGLFYKNFDSPIEQVFTAGSDPRISFFNVEGVEIFGGEVEFSKNLGFAGSFMKYFSISGNYAHILSDVTLGNITNSESLEESRPLQGQSNYTANFLLDFEHERSKVNASLAYNVYGKRIAYTAPEGLPNIWEMPFHQLDFVISKRFGKSMKAQAKVKNILNPKARFLQGDREWQAWRKGITVTLGASMEI